MTNTTMTANAIESVREAFDFTVEKFPLSDPDGLKTPFYGLFRSDNSKLVGNAVTQRYRAHQTDDVLAITEAAITALEDEDIQVRTHFRNGHYVEYAPSNAERKAIYGTKDNVFPRFLLRAGYDGRAFTVTLGYYRDLCLNMSMLRSVGKSVYRSIRHTSSLRTKMDELISDFATLGKGWDQLTKAIERMESRDIILTDFLDILYGKPDPDSKRSVTVHKNRTESIVRRLMRERVVSGRPQLGSDFSVSGWEAYNAVQGYVQHEATRKQGFNSDMDRIILAAKDSSVTMAEQIILAA